MRRLAMSETWRRDAASGQTDEAGSAGRPRRAHRALAARHPAFKLRSSVSLWLAFSRSLRPFCSLSVVSVISVCSVVAALAAQGAAPAFDSNRAWEHLRQLVAIGPRPSGSTAIEQARIYIRQQLAAAGAPAVDQAWDAQTPSGTVHMVNLIASIPGAGRNRVLVTGHYDTKRFREFRFVGASDGASSAAFLIELARVLKARPHPVTYDLVFLDGEEAVCRNWDDCSRPGAPDNTYGSRHYVDVEKRNGTLATIKANILVDMIADRDLRLKRETYSTPWLTDLVWNAARQKKLDQFFVADQTQIEDDHLAFLAAGVPSVDIIDLEYPPWHTAGDTLDAVSARSLQIVGDAVVSALPALEARVGKEK
jgi:glutaminyl-peptide cyclotransferase